MQPMLVTKCENLVAHFNSAYCLILSEFPRLLFEALRALESDLKTQCCQVFPGSQTTDQCGGLVTELSDIWLVSLCLDY